MSKKLNCLSFFSGCMGLDIGLEKAGINTILACDFDSASRQTISSNKKDIPVLDDILNYTAKDIREISGIHNNKIDLIVGGPPCQAFSTAGKRKSFNDPRGNVFLYFIDIISDLKPRYIVIENVRGLLSASIKHTPHIERTKNYKSTIDEVPGSALMLIKEKLENIGYKLSFNLYNSANYGVPQKRERVVILGTLDSEEVQYLQPTHSINGEYGLPKWNTFSSAVKDLHEKNMTGIQFPEKRVKYYKLLKPGQYWKHLPSESLKKEALGGAYFSGGGKTGFLRRLDWDSPSPTLVTHPAMPATDLAHPEINRPLSIEEYKRIQQFPDNWKIEGAILKQYKQVGNAVPVGLGFAIGKAIINHSKKIHWDDHDFKEFPYSRYKNTSHNDWHQFMLNKINSISKTSTNFELDID